MNSSSFDYVIIGQGLAGSILAYTLIEKYQSRVLVIDDGHLTSSSKVAAGIFNPITGKRNVKTWQADTIWPTIATFYHELEVKFNVKLLHFDSVFKLFDSVAEQNYWESESIDKSFENYIKIVPSGISEFSSLIKDTYGGISIHNSGWLDCEKLLLTIRNYLIENNAYLQSSSIPDALIDSKIIYCEGYKAAFNPLWSWLPWQLSKGEILEIKTNNTNLKNILNKSVFVCPTPTENSFKVGSTYAWDSLDSTTTEKARIELETKLNSYFNHPFSIQNQFAGIRPTVKNRRPFLGVHPEHANSYIFNGFGSKAVSLAPWFAIQMAKNLCNAQPLPVDVDISQFVH